MGRPSNVRRICNRSFHSGTSCWTSMANTALCKTFYLFIIKRLHWRIKGCLLLIGWRIPPCSHNRNSILFEGRSYEPCRWSTASYNYHINGNMLPITTYSYRNEIWLTHWNFIFAPVTVLKRIHVMPKLSRVYIYTARNFAIFMISCEDEYSYYSRLRQFKSTLKSLNENFLFTLHPQASKWTMFFWLEDLADRSLFETELWLNDNFFKLILP